MNETRPQSVFQNKSSADVMKAITSIYFPHGASYADLTWGKGVFWRNLPDVNVIGFDLAPRFGSEYGDSRNVQMGDKSVDVAVFDPPFQHGAGGSTTLHQEDDYTRMKNQAEIHQLYMDTAPEILRISRLGAVVKCGDMVEAGRFMPTHVMLAAWLAQNGFGWPADIAILNSGVVRPVRHTRVLHWQQVHSYFLVYRWNEKAPRSPFVASQSASSAVEVRG